MTAQRWPEDVGSVAEEAGRLLESLRRAGHDAAAARPPAGGHAGPAGPTRPAPTTGDRTQDGTDDRTDPDEGPTGRRPASAATTPCASGAPCAGPRRSCGT